jgi:hypothetical protein
MGVTVEFGPCGAFVGLDSSRSNLSARWRVWRAPCGVPDLLWDDVREWFDPEANGVLPNVAVPGRFRRSSAGP